jgi:hypothetical protein
MGRTRDVSKILTSNTSILSLASASTTYATKVSTGLNLIIPSTIANTGGSASIGTNGTVSFASASAISLNGVFTSIYDNYRVFITISSASSGSYLYARFRASGSDNSTTNYRYANTLWNTVSGATQNTLLTNNDTAFAIARVDNTTATYDSVIDIGQPFNSVYTTYKGKGTGSAVVGQNYGQIMDSNGFFVDAASFDGFTIYNSTISGKIRVYGYNQ